MKYKICTCTYFKLKEMGYEPVDHAYNCPLSEGYYLETPKRIILPEGDNPYGEYNIPRLTNDEENPFKEVWYRKSDKEKYNKCYEKNIQSWSKKGKTKKV